MVISCPECSTRFRVDENKIPAQGAKIRCARCKHIFAVNLPEPEAAQPESLQIPAEKTATDDDFGLDNFGSPEVGAGTQDDFDPSSFENTPNPEENDFSLDDDYGNVSLGDESSAFDEDESFSFGTPASAPASTQTSSVEEQKDFSFNPAQQQAADPTDHRTDDFNEPPANDTMSLPPALNNFDTDDTDVPPPTKHKSASRSPLSVVILFVLFLILAILITGSVLIWKNGPEGVTQLIENLTGQPPAPKLEGNIRLTNLQGSFTTNRKEGEIFVIRGIAINERKEARAAIQVKGIVFDKRGKQLRQKTIFCGNPIGDKDLRKLPYSKLEEIMDNQFGESLVNLNVTPGQSIAFTIVFHKLPKTLSEFVVEVADSKPASP